MQSNTTDLAAVRERACPLCATPSGQPCQPKPEGDHLARFLDPYTAGQLTKAYMAMTLGELVVIDEYAVVPAAPQTCGYRGADGRRCARIRHSGEYEHLDDAGREITQTEVSI